MMPRMPKISVRPLATRNSTRPYCTPFSTWMRKITGSINKEPAPCGHRLPCRAGPGLRQHLAAASRILERFPCDSNVLVLLAHALAQVAVLDRVVRPRHRPLAARAVDRHAFHRGDHRLRCLEVALHRFEADIE